MPLHAPTVFDCPVCDGYGVDLDDPDLECEECDGSGRLDNDEET